MMQSVIKPIDNCFTAFEQTINDYNLPERFTFPFYYQPHELCVLAAEQLQKNNLVNHKWPHNFGLENDKNKIIGKMFGVLLVQNSVGKVGFLAAFSGKLAEQNDIAGFVPPVFDLLTQGSFFLAEQKVINQLNEQIQGLQQAPRFAVLQSQLATIKQSSELSIAELRLELIENRKWRKKCRTSLNEQLTGNKLQMEMDKLSQQSVSDKWRLKELTSSWQQKLALIETELNELNANIKDKKQRRKALSSALQHNIFEKYQFLNQAVEHKSLASIFAETPFNTPPAGAGECAAPKLLQYAFLHQLKPLAIAEFWWGASPKSEVKKHKQYYPACMGKCEPILKHMLAGITLDDNPFLHNPAANQSLEIIYQDEDVVVVNKPAGLLSVPGKQVSDSVYQRIKILFPTATGPLIVHRLDMSTSGLMVLALNPQANKFLQRQFIHREVHKKYVALVDGIITPESGEINLPLMGDVLDRPRQLVCEKQGKPAKTYWQVMSRDHTQKQTKLLLQPLSGRTHQLRVHCAHYQGLNMPIVGDDLYGTQGPQRLHLHAQLLRIKHPISQEFMHFECLAAF